MSGRQPTADDRRLWAAFAASVRPLAGKRAPKLDAVAGAPTSVRITASIATPTGGRAALAQRPTLAAPPLLPLRSRRRLASRRERPQRTVDLHGHDQDGARRLLTRELLRAWDDGARLVLVVTGKGRTGDGVLRRHAPDWLSEAPLRAVISAVEGAHFRHGGDGALYVALKRKS